MRYQLLAWTHNLARGMARQAQAPAQLLGGQSHVADRQAAMKHSFYLSGGRAEVLSNPAVGTLCLGQSDMSLLANSGLSRLDKTVLKAKSSKAWCRSLNISCCAILECGLPSPKPSSTSGAGQGPCDVRVVGKACRRGRATSSLSARIWGSGDLRRGPWRAGAEEICILLTGAC